VYIMILPELFNYSTILLYIHAKNDGRSRPQNK
jgi:hypothetical protein